MAPEVFSINQNSSSVNGKTLEKRLSSPSPSEKKMAQKLTPLE